MGLYSYRTRNHPSRASTTLANPETLEEATKLTRSDTATVQKIITEILPPSSGVTFGRDARDLLIECCVEFIRMLSSEANDISEKEARKTIATEHIEKALKELDFEEYIPEILAAVDDFKEVAKVCELHYKRKLRWQTTILFILTIALQTREKRVNKMEMSGMTDEELAKMQEELFASASVKHNTGNEEGAA